MKSTNFEFLRPDWNELADLGGFAEHYIKSDPQSAQVKSRLLAERIAMLACNKLKLQVSDSFFSMLKDLQDTKLLSPALLCYFHSVRKAGNDGAHNTLTNNSTDNTLETIRAAFNISRWWYVFNKNTKENVPLNFNETFQTNTTTAQQELRQLEVLEQLNTKLNKENEELRKQQKSLSTSELDKIKEQSKNSAESLNFSEEEARKYLIDTLFVEAGWNLSDPDDIGIEVELFEQGTYSGKGYADYVCYDDDGTALAVIEAKRPEIDPDTAQAQAQDYANALQKLNTNNERPLIILTNGYETKLLDDQGGPNSLPIKGYALRKIYGIPSKESLQYRVKFQQKNMLDPAIVKLNPEIAGRPYQLEAIKSVAERFGEERKRKALVVQATGTGKTRVAIAITDLLMRANFAKRVLFLCDRTELRRQAKNAYTSFMPDRKVEVLKRTKESDIEITIATYPAMMKRFQNYDIAYFDLIIADESHRSIYNKFRDLFIYFDALQIGLTATPRNAISHDTYKMFDCNESDPTYYYEYEKAVEEGYLVDFKPISVTTKFLREGIDSNKLTAEEIKQLEKDGFDIEDVDTDSSQINSNVYVKGTNQEILRNLMENGLQDASQNGVGKSIIFARNIKHASLLQTWFQEMYPEYGPNYCALIHSDMQRCDTLIDNFKTPFKNPVIAISVDMLDTGIDVPEVLNLVFAKPVKSWVKFWQMIGRGTRLCENLLLDDEGKLKDKEEFYIFDHYGNFEFFENTKNYEEASASPSLLERLLQSRIELAQSSLQNFNKENFDTTIALARQMIQALPNKSLPVQEKMRIKDQVLQGNVLENFDPSTVAMVKNTLVPLMRYLVIENAKAYSFDLLITELQHEIIKKTSCVDNLKDKLFLRLHSLQNNIEAVKALFSEIEEVLSEDFWTQETKVLLKALEEKRKKLRGIMQFSLDSERPPFVQKILNIADKDVIIKYLNPAKTPQNQMQEYRLRVRSLLEPHFQTNPTLQKLRRGEKLTQKDLDILLSLTLTQNPSVDLATLKEFYPNFEELERELRAIVGLDGEHVKERFKDFYESYPLSSQQISFLNLLQKHIEKYGAIQIETLYQNPFSRIHANGPEGLFTNEKQLEDFFNIINLFTNKAQANI